MHALFLVAALVPSLINPPPGALAPRPVTQRWSARLSLPSCSAAELGGLELRESASFSEDWAVSQLLHDCFGGPTFTYYTSLKSPGLNANVFFRPTDPPVLVVAVDPSGGTILGAAQLMRVKLTQQAGSGTGRIAAYVQSVAVREGYRRRGIASSLMGWCEARAHEAWGGEGSAEQPGGQPAIDEMWLALAQDNEEALPFYEGRGYKVRGTNFGNRLMSKSLLPTEPPRGARRASEAAMCLQPEEAREAPAASAPAASRQGIGWGPLAINLGVQGMYIGVACFGISLLLQPFGGPSAAALLGIGGEWVPAGAADASPGAALGFLRPIVEMALGSGVAVAELKRQGVLDALSPPVAAGEDGALRYSAAQAQQMRPLWEIVAAEQSSSSAAAAVGGWQLAIGLAEELYYRGLVQSAGVLALDALLPAAGGVLGAARGGVVEVVPLLLASALFGLVHTEFVDALDSKQGEDAAETKARWFWESASYGALYGLLYVGTGHRILAPLCTHAGLNVGLCLRDWRRMRATPEAELRRMFEPVAVAAPGAADSDNFNS